MRIALLDVNVLIALFDPVSPHHSAAHDWFNRDGWKGWATSTIILNGCVRVRSNPAYPAAPMLPAEVVESLREVCGTPRHQFWNDSVNVLDPAVIKPELFGSYKNITDVSLLALACRNRGQLVTFDRSIPVRAVVGATSENLTVLGR